jgi:hypothetical protein
VTIATAVGDASDRAAVGTGPRTRRRPPRGIEAKPRDRAEATVAVGPEVAQRVARRCAGASTATSHAATPRAPAVRATPLRLTVDTGDEEPRHAESPWLTTHHTRAGRPHTDEPG